MRKIVFLSLSFLGICKGFAQNTTDTNQRDSAVKSISIADQHRNDSLAARPSAKLFPNPATNKVEIEIKGFGPGFAQLQLLDNNQNIIREDKRLLLNGNETIMVMFSLLPGIYFILIKQNDRSCKRKLVVQ